MPLTVSYHYTTNKDIEGGSSLVEALTSCTGTKIRCRRILSLGLYSKSAGNRSLSSPWIGLLVLLSAGTESLTTLVVPALDRFY